MVGGVSILQAGCVAASCELCVCGCVGRTISRVGGALQWMAGQIFLKGRVFVRA